MTRAFLLKDTRIAARAGAVLPGVPTLLVVQALAFAGAAVWILGFGEAVPSSFWGPFASSFVTVAFFLAALGPAAAGFAGAMQEAVPEIAESLSSAPLDPLRFYLGKAALPAIQGFAVQLALLPTWAFLAGVGAIPAAAAASAFLASMAVVPVSALSGSTRLAAGVPRRSAIGFRRGAGQGANSQLGFVIVGMFWSSQVARGLGSASHGAGVIGALLGAARPLLPMLLLDGSRTRLFAAELPSILLTPLMAVTLMAWRISVAVVGSERTEAADKRRALTTVIVARGLFAAWVFAAVFVAGRAAAAAAGGLALLWAVGAGIPGATRREEARDAALSTLVPGLLGTLAAGFGGLAFWIAASVTGAVTAAALPPRKIEGRRAFAFTVLLLIGIGAPAIAAFVTPLAPVIGPIGSVFTVMTCASLPAAIVSMAQDRFGAVPLWDSVEAAVPGLHPWRPWIVAPLLFGAIAAIAIWRSSRKKG